MTRRRSRKRTTITLTPSRAAGILLSVGALGISTGIGLVFLPAGIFAAGFLLLAGGLVVLRGVREVGP